MVEYVHGPPLPRQDRPQAGQLLSRKGKDEHKCDIVTNSDDGATHYMQPVNHY